MLSVLASSIFDPSKLIRHGLKYRAAKVAMIWFSETISPDHTD